MAFVVLFLSLSPSFSSVVSVSRSGPLASDRDTITQHGLGRGSLTRTAGRVVAASERASHYSIDFRTPTQQSYARVIRLSVIPQWAFIHPFIHICARH